MDAHQAAHAVAVGGSPELLRRAGREPRTFYFYDPYETNPKFSYDPTGAVVAGRYAVRFNGDWNQQVGPGRSDAQIELIEVA